MITKRHPYILLFASFIGLFASIKLIIEKIAVLADSSYVPSCDINPVLACGSVINTPQAAFFGFPNPIIGIIGFTAVFVLAVLFLFKIPLPSFIPIGLLFGSILGFFFICYLIYQSLYTISALCPWCMVVWASLLIILWQNIVYAAKTNVFNLPTRFTAVIVILDWFILASFFLIIIGLIFLNWIDFWLGW